MLIRAMAMAQSYENVVGYMWKLQLLANQHLKYAHDVVKFITVTENVK